jgi:hypothetical protein
MWLRIQTLQLFARRRAIFGCFIFVLLFASSVSISQPANPETAVNVSVSAAGQHGPLQIVGLRPPERGHGNAIDMLLRNTSNIATVDYWVQPLVVARDRLGPVWDKTNAHAAIRPGYGVIGPGGETWSQEMSVLSLTTVMIAAKDLHSTCLRITPVILEVHFADGTKWNLDKIDDALNRADKVNSEPACAGSRAAESDFAQLSMIIEGVGASHSNPAASDRSFFRSVDRNGVQSFSFSCGLHRVDDSRVALQCDR